MVYVLVSEGKIKIGRSVRPHKRFAELKVSPEENTLIVHTCFDFELESWLHKHLTSYHISGEWFCASAYNETLRLLDSFKDRFGIKRVDTFKTYETLTSSENIEIFGMSIGYSSGLYNLTDAVKHLKSGGKLSYNYKPETFLKSESFARLNSLRMQEIKSKRGVKGGLFVPFESLKLFILMFDDVLFLNNLGVNDD